LIDKGGNFMNINSASSNRVSQPLPPPMNSTPQLNPAAQNASPRIDVANKTNAATADVLGPGSKGSVKSDTEAKPEPAQQEQKKPSFKDILAKIGEGFKAVTDFIGTVLTGIGQIVKPIMNIASTIGSGVMGMIK
jgi:hypothetical protein